MTGAQKSVILCELSERAPLKRPAAGAARPNLENDTERKKRARREEAKRGTEARAEGPSEAEEESGAHRGRSSVWRGAHERDSEDSEEFRRSAEARDGRPEREGLKERKRTV